MTIRCPHCEEPLRALDVLDAGTVAIPGSSLVHFTCPACAAAAWARLGDGHLAVGAPAAEPARFVPAVSAPEPSLSVRPGGEWLDCWHAGRYRRYPAARAA